MKRWTMLPTLVLFAGLALAAFRTGSGDRGIPSAAALGCASCHQGVNVGGNMYQVFGVMHDYFADRDSLQDADLGRATITHDPRDRHFFKVPSLRNVALTAPYFHDASAPSLALAVSIMGWYQLGRPLTGGEVDLLLAFLGSLTGELPGGALPPDTTSGSLS